MIKLFQLSLSFLKHSKLLTFSAFFSIFIACFLGVGLFQLYSNIDDTVQEQVEQYQDSEADLSEVIEEQKAEYRWIHRFLKFLYGLIFTICCLFVVSIFRGFMNKYVREMAIIRTFGGRMGQVGLMFFFMSVTVSFFACLAAGVAAAAADSFLLNDLNQKYAFFRGGMVMDWPVFFGTLLFSFLLLNALLLFVFSRSQYGLPVQIFHQTETGLRRRKEGLRFLFLRKVLGTDGYLAWKLLLPKWKQNVMIILLIVCMTVFSYVGESFLTVLKMNHYAWYQDLLKGADGHCELMQDFGADTVETETVDRIREQCEREQAALSYLHGCYDGQMGSAWGFYTTDLSDFRKRFIREPYQEISSVPLGEQMIVGNMLAEQDGYHLGDQVRLQSKYLKEEKGYTIVGILDWSPYGMQIEEQVVVDRENFRDFRTGEKDDGNGSRVLCWFYGDRDAIQHIFMDLKREGWDTTGYYSEKILEDTKKQFRQLNVLSKIVVWGLMLIVATGWMNSARGILVSQKRDFRVMRLLGVGRRRMQKICYLQIGSYLLTGIAFGSIVGVGISKKLWEKELYYGVTLHMHWESVWGILLLFMVASLFLKRTIREVSE